MAVVELIVVGILLHLVADWFFQNEWMAINKVKRMSQANLPTGEHTTPLELWLRSQWWMRHPAAYVHACIHTLIQVPIFGPWALIIGILHLIIDTRTPLGWWGRVFKQTSEGAIAMHIAIWRDQVAHFIVIALVAVLVGSVLS